MTKSDFVYQARKELLINKDSEKALEILKKFDASVLQDEKLYCYTLALAYMENKDYTSAFEVYFSIKEFYQAGFCKLLESNEFEAVKLWEKAADSPLRRWGFCLLDLINARKSSVPTYLQIRNSLETDLGYFIQAGRSKYAENIMKCDELLLSINLETYKLFGKVMLYNGYLNLAQKYFLKSIDVIPFDAENYYFLARYYHHSGQDKEALTFVKQCLDYNPDHIPAKKFLQILTSPIN